MNTQSMQAKISIDQLNKELRERNEIRLKAAKIALGEKYLLHPNNQMSRAKFEKIQKVTS